MVRAAAGPRAGDVPDVRRRTPLRPVDGRRPALHPAPAGPARVAPEAGWPWAADPRGGRSTAGDHSDRPHWAGAGPGCSAAAQSVGLMNEGGGPVQADPRVGRHDRIDRSAPAATVQILPGLAVARERGAGHPECRDPGPWSAWEPGRAADPDRMGRPAMDGAPDQPDAVAAARARACRDQAVGVARLRDDPIALRRTSA